MANPVLCVIKVLEWPINSPYQDYGPALPADESQLIFTSARDTSKFDKKNRSIFEDVVRSKREAGGGWSVPEVISPRINDTFHDAVTYLSPDGKTIFYTMKEAMVTFTRPPLMERIGQTRYRWVRRSTQFHGKPPAAFLPMEINFTSPAIDPVDLEDWIFMSVPSLPMEFGARQ